MKDNIKDIERLYNGDTSREHSRLTRHQLEFDITLDYLKKYCKEIDRILEIGCATGRYTTELLKMKKSVTAVDIAENMIEACKRFVNDTVPSDKDIQYFVADVRDLQCIDDNAYEAALVMGPLYHLVYEEDRKLALEQTKRKLKDNGLILSSFISRYGMLGDIMKKWPEIVEKEGNVESIIRNGMESDIGQFRASFVDPNEIEKLHEDAGFKTIVLAGVEPAISSDDESYNRLDKVKREKWRRILFEVSSNRSIVGASRHLLYIGEKK